MTSGMRGVLVLLAAVAAAAVQVELLAYDPVAAPGAVVVAGAARFTVLTERVIRWGPRGKARKKTSLLCFCLFCVSGRF